MATTSTGPTRKSFVHCFHSVPVKVAAVAILMIMRQERSESARERRIALYKSDQHHHVAVMQYCFVHKPSLVVVVVVFLR